MKYHIWQACQKPATLATTEPYTGYLTNQEIGEAKTTHQ